MPLTPSQQFVANHYELGLFDATARPDTGAATKLQRPAAHRTMSQHPHQTWGPPTSLLSITTRKHSRQMTRRKPPRPSRRAPRLSTSAQTRTAFTSCGTTTQAATAQGRATKAKTARVQTLRYAALSHAAAPMTSATAALIVAVKRVADLQQPGPSASSSFVVALRIAAIETQLQRRE